MGEIGSKPKKKASLTIQKDLLFYLGRKKPMFFFSYLFYFNTSKNFLGKDPKNRFHNI